jgi:hypothetical protein
MCHVWSNGLGGEGDCFSSQFLSLARNCAANFALSYLHFVPPLAAPWMFVSEEATLVTARGLYVHEVAQTSTFRSLS